MKVLVVGSGGREHALVIAMLKSHHKPEVICAPGNAGIAQHVQCVPIGVEELASLADFAEQEKIDFTVIGPEVPLARGIVDVFRMRGMRIFGPCADAAEIESDKALAKKILNNAGIPQAKYFTSDNFSDAKSKLLAFTEYHGCPVVIKASGLFAGKGVVVCKDEMEALETLESMLLKGEFKEAGETVVVEQFLQGPEFSIFALSDGIDVKILGSAQDCKPAYPGGPNTGGMGAFSPVPFLTEDILKAIQKDILQPTIDMMRRIDKKYRGLLYLGGMLTEDGPKVLEYNCRFGDPETQVIVPRLKSDLLDLLLATTEDGVLKDMEIELIDEAAVCVVNAAAGYPGGYKKGFRITGIDEAEEVPTTVYHAGTSFNDNHELVTDGGRVLGVMGIGKTISDARDKAYAGSSVIYYDGAWFRTDIAERV